MLNLTAMAKDATSNKGFWRTANNAAFFAQNGITEEGELVGKQFRELGGHFISQVAGSVKALFELSPKGKKRYTAVFFIAI